MEILKTILDISPFSWSEIISAMIAGTVVGLERQLSGNPIGITIGTNRPVAGIKLSLLAVIILTGVDTAEKRIKSLRKGLHEKYSKVQD